MEFFNVLLAKKLEDDRDPRVEGLSVTENGRYAEEGVVYSPVIVNVPPPVLKTKTITSNNTYRAADDNADGYSEVTVNVPLPANGYLLESASGEIVTVTDAAPLNLQACEVDIEPIQDLHGYDYPWPAGGGKNKVNPDEFEYADLSAGIIYPGDNTVSGYIPVLPNTAYILSYEGDYELGEVAFYTSAKVYINSTWGLNFTTPANCYFIRFELGTHVSVSAVKPMVRLASETDPTFEPYSNVCPISGYESVEIRGCGKNMLSTSVANVKYRNSGLTWTGNSCTTNGLTFSLLTDNDGNVTGINVTGTSTADSAFFLDSFLNDYLPGDYIVSCEKTVSDGNIYMVTYTVSGDYKLFVGDTEQNFYYDGLRTGSGAGNIAIGVWANSTVSCTLKPMIRPASITDATYEPYIPVTDLTIPLGETVYGGTLDVESGTLTVTTKIVDLESFTWTTSLDVHTTTAPSDMMPSPAAAIDEALNIAEKFKLSKTWAASTPDNAFHDDGNGTLYVKCSSGTPTGKLVYQLKQANRITISLPPHQIKLLQGVNNIYANSGDTAIEYFGKGV